MIETSPISEYCFLKESGKMGAARWGDKIMYNFDDVYQYRAY